MESLWVGILVALAVWLLLRHARQAKARRAAAAMPSATMPRIGTPGSATPEQLERMRACHFETTGGWSREEAQLILDAVDFLRAALREVARSDDPPIEIQNRVLVFLLADEALRRRVMQWGEARRRGAASNPVLAGPHALRIAAFIKGLA
jgi:hypothetical protein